MNLSINNYIFNISLFIFSISVLKSNNYKLIFNCDGNAVIKDANRSYEKWISNIFDPLEGSSCDVIFWCDGSGGNTANYKSKILDTTDYNKSENMYFVRELIDAGIDPPKAVIAEAKKRSLDIFYSYRMNDIHDSFIISEFPRFKKDNPSWLIGESSYNGLTNYASALNFAVPDVITLKQNILSEIIDNYEFDGIELDLMRSPPYFKFDEIELNTNTLTELIRFVREKTLHKNMKLAIRVGESLESCMLDGFEVETWIGENLVDILVLGSGVIDLNVNEFVRLSENSNVSIYPCIYGWPSNYYPIPKNLSDAMALNYWNQGASGLYLFNWFLHEPTSEESSSHMINSIKYLGKKEQVFENFIELCFAADRGKSTRSYPNNWLNSKLPFTLSVNNDLALDIPIYHNVNRYNKVSLNVNISNEKIKDLSVSLNGSEFKGVDLKMDNISLDLPADQLLYGQNTVKLHTSDENETIVQSLEVHISRYNNFSDSDRTYVVGNNWFFNECIGYFYQSDKSWIFSYNYGWLYPALPSFSTCWFYSIEYGWFFLHQDSFDGHGRFYIFSTKSWVNLKH